MPTSPEKFTPGQWKVAQAKHDPNAFDVVDAESGVEVARLPWGRKDHAHLIAAAPDLFASHDALLDALREAGKGDDRYTRVLLVAMAARAKARGWQ